MTLRMTHPIQVRASGLVTPAHIGRSYFSEISGLLNQEHFPTRHKVRETMLRNDTIPVSFSNIRYVEEDAH